MSYQSEIRAWAVASAAAFCLSALGYRVLTAPAIPDLAPTVAQANAALAGLPAVLSHVQATSDAATGVLRSASPVLGKLNAAIDLTSHRINDLCPAPNAPDAAIRPCGTLADTNRTLATLRGTSGQVERSLLVFNQHEGDLFTQEREAYAQMNKSVTDFDALVSDPNLRGIVAHANTVTGDAAAVTTDGRTWVHQKLYPTKTKGFVSGFEAAGDVMKHWMPSLF